MTAKKQEPKDVIKAYNDISDEMTRINGQLIEMEWNLAEALYKVKTKELYRDDHKFWGKYIQNHGLFVNFKQTERFVWAWEEWHLRLKFPLKVLRKYRVSTLGQLPKVTLTREQANKVLKMIGTTQQHDGKRMDKRKKVIEYMLNIRQSSSTNS